MEVAPFFVDFHYLLSIFTIFCRFTPFFIDFHVLHTFVAIYALFPQFFLGKNSLLRNITRFLHVCVPVTLRLSATNPHLTFWLPLGDHLVTTWYLIWWPLGDCLRSEPLLCGQHIAIFKSRLTDPSLGEAFAISQWNSSQIILRKKHFPLKIIAPIWGVKPSPSKRGRRCNGTELLHFHGDEEEEEEVGQGRSFGR